MTKSKVFGLVLLVLLVLALGGLALIWAPDRSAEDLSPRWAPPPSQFVLIDGVKAHFRDEGLRDDPEPLILLHGTSSSLHTWDGWTQALKAKHRVIRVDLPGFGLTGPTVDGDYRMQVYSHFVASLMDALQVKRAVLVGNSLGGYVAWKTAVDYPERVSKLVLVDAAGYSTMATSVPLGFKIAQIPMLSGLMGHVLPRSVIESSLRNVYADPSKINAELVDRYYELALRAGNRQALAARFSQNQPGEFESQIKGIKQPTLIIWGGQDRLIPPDNAQRFHRDIAKSRLVMFDKLGHVGHEEDPASTVAAAHDFLEIKSETP
ncbi:MAG: alpha/beta hydrolase [Sulfuritalea sp.]|nr:alpha/beta hydrolase [Sulfuritalea sp.]